MEPQGFITQMIILYKEEGTSPDRLMHDLYEQHQIDIEFTALMERWNRL